MNTSFSKVTAMALLIAGSGAALAHPGHEMHSSFMSGFAHPMGGLDHLLAMIAVGLWASSLGGRAIWAVPMAFVAMMFVGGSAAVAGTQVPFVEQGIVLSVIVLGALVLGAKRLPTLVCSAIAGAFAFFHGAAHGMEMPLNASGIEYALGFVLATAMLHVVGLAFGQLMNRFGTTLVTRMTGSLIALVGMILALA